MISPCKDCPNRHTACHGSCDIYKEWLTRYHEGKERSKNQRYALYIPCSYARDKAKIANMKSPQRWR